ncbi:RNA ligase-domain-containing protein [Halteromyces radiatus]|uniref:RNA ligase-domain-containing protein n=1 Tax=Halteromyces radiatus TaxID=101107 RepID=UPI0022204E66|nr:RNA ligase-domain-containing protein [Halteromyces radiatus]KAI8084858.1 RNA ligase-domain-containing protein [Halteromyces radiatus]
MNIPSFNLDWEEQDHKVITSLYTHEKEKPKELRHKVFQVNGTDWTSWTMRDSLYKKHRYPTQARGLFTSRRSNGKYTVNVRGYDKFFNINETDATQWHALEKDTKGPYEITAKENGCIIFIAAISNTEIVATSKHMIPDPLTGGTSHGGIGYRWALEHLDSVGRTPEELAAWLFKYRVTMVAELCDDEFEEHIVPYRTLEERGLYLHGINYNTTTLHTLPMQTVRSVAHYFGLRTVDTKMMDDLGSVRQLADSIQQNTTGIFDWMDNNNSRESEGIVVRCQQQQHDFFFKVKNDTYLMYREYREVTKALVQVNVDHHSTLSVSIKQPKSNTKKPKVRFEKTLYYVHWLEQRVKDHPEWFKDYLHNKGIVAVRQAFEQDWQDGKITHLDDRDLNRLVERDTK